MVAAQPLPAELQPAANPRRRPLPQERPYDLGERSDRVAMESYPQRSNSASLAAEALARHPADRRMADVSPDTEPPRQMAARLRAAEARTVPVTEVTANARAPFAAQPPGVSPVSAYAPVRYDGSQAVASGRGLY